MRRFTERAALYLLLVASVACHPFRGPVVGGTQQQVGGTIAGIVSATGGTLALASRKVTAINTATQTRYDTTTAANGGYTIKVPEGTYRIEIELRPGEALSKQPGETHINNGDLDSGRDFVVTVK
jgi:Carboxypeptidase regulatory-like domain